MSFKVRGAFAVLCASAIVLSLSACEDAEHDLPSAGKQIENWLEHHNSDSLPPGLIKLASESVVATDAARSYEHTEAFKEQLKQAGDGLLGDDSPLCAVGLRGDDNSRDKLAQDIQNDTNYQFPDFNHAYLRGQAATVYRRVESDLNSAAPTLADKEDALQAIDEFRELFCTGHDVLG
jgi:hypothetical protein